MPAIQAPSSLSWENVDCLSTLDPQSSPGTSAYILLPPTPQISGDEFYADVAKDILQYVSRNLSHRVCVH